MSRVLTAGKRRYSALRAKIACGDQPAIPEKYLGCFHSFGKVLSCTCQAHARCNIMANVNSTDGNRKKRKEAVLLRWLVMGESRSRDEHMRFAETAKALARAV